jgi:seryl-tRNA synthetase
VHPPRDAAVRSYRDALCEAGLLIASGVPGVYGWSGVFEDVVERVDRHVGRAGAEPRPEILRFPPLLSRAHYERMDHLEAFPNLMGSVHTFTGAERDHVELMRRRSAGEDWSAALAPTAVMMTPATCYPLYPTATGVLPPEGRTVDLRSFVFRHEPSDDPTRLQIFRMHEYVRLGTPAQALQHRDDWIARGLRMLAALGLDARAVVANDPFFGRGGRVMAAMQREQSLKYELVVPIVSAEAPTAVASSNYHLDHFSQTFGIKSPDGHDAHTACVGFGLERVALALFRAHGLDPGKWPSAVSRALEP